MDLSAWREREMEVEEWQLRKVQFHFPGQKEQEEALMKVIRELKDEKGALMPILQKAQDIYGYLPIEVQKMISDETGSQWRRFTAWRRSIRSLP